jgi:hypothetical protein
MQESRFLTASETARLVGKHPSWVSRRLKAGRLKAIRDPRDLRRQLIAKSDLDELLKPLRPYDEARKAVQRTA